MTKLDVLKKVDQRWADFRSASIGLSDEQMLENGACGLWSCKDLLVHIALWEEEALKYLPVVYQGDPLPRYKHMYGGIDAFNAKTMAEHSTLSLAQAQLKSDATHKALMDYLADIPEVYFKSSQRFYRRLMLDAGSHYPLHTEMIQNWRKEKGY